MKANCSAVDYYLPKGKLTNDELNCEIPEWSVESSLRSRMCTGGEQ